MQAAGDKSQILIPTRLPRIHGSFLRRYLSPLYSHVRVVQRLEVLVVEDPQLRHELLLLLQHVADDLLAVVHILGHHLLRDRLLRLADLLGHLLHVVAGEPASLAVQGPLPPAAILFLGYCDKISFLEL